MPMTRFSKPYESTREAVILENIYQAARFSGITLTKNQAAALVGGRYVLERLIARKKIRAIKTGNRQNSHWECNIEDVLHHVPDFS